MTFPTQLLGFRATPQDQISYIYNQLPPDPLIPGTATTTLTVPEGVFQASAVVIGGGGGGSGGGTGSGGSGGGGGSSLSWGTFSVEPGDVLRIQVGVGGNGGGSGSNGFEGGNSSIFLVERGGSSVSPAVEILFAEGGNGGVISGPDAPQGGDGGFPNAASSSEIQVYASGGGVGGKGGRTTSGIPQGAGGGGCAGYTGVGGSGGGRVNVPGIGIINVSPQAPPTNSGAGGGGGYKSVDTAEAILTRGLGYGGGGVGAYGYTDGDPASTGTAGVNDSSGGGGGSFFDDPGISISPLLVGSGSTSSSTFSFSNLKFEGGITGIEENDFILVISGSDSTGGLTKIGVPVGFTTISFSDDSEYIISSAGVLTETIPGNVSNPTKDLNFSTSYLYAPPSITGISGLQTPAIHNIIVLRFIPLNANFIYANDSYDPGVRSTPPSTSEIAAGAGFMPNPPELTDISAGSLGIIFGFIANVVLNASNDISASGSDLFASASGGKFGELGQGVAVMAQYTNGEGGTFGGLNVVSSNLSAGTPVSPGAFLTGTSSHARAYTMEIRRSNAANPITLVGTASTGDFVDAGGNFQQTSNGSYVLPSNIASGDLIIYANAFDGPVGGDSATPYNRATLDWDGGGTADFDTYAQTDQAIESDASQAKQRFNGTSTDSRVTGNLFQANNGLGFLVQRIIVPAAAIGNNPIVDLNNNSSVNLPSSSLIIILRGAQSGLSNYEIWDNRTSDPLTPSDPNIATIYGPPDPPEITTTVDKPLILSIGMVDNISISNVTTGVSALTDIQAPPGWTLLDNQSYGVQNNGAIVMSAIKSNLSAGSTNPDAFSGGGGNIWAAQTLAIGGPGAETDGNNFSAGQWGAGGGGRSEDVNNNGMSGANGSARIMWGGSKLYPYTQGNTGISTVIEFVV